MKDTHYNKEHFVHVYLFTMVKYSHIFKKNREIEYDKVFMCDLCDTFEIRNITSSMSRKS